MTLLRRHPAIAYFMLAYAISWGGIGAFILSRPLRDATAADDFPLVFAAMALGPSLSGVFMAWATGGSQRSQELLQSMIRWRFNAGWYVCALGVTPSVLLPVLMVLSRNLSEDFAPRFQPELFAFGLLAGALEEIGWSGFAAPSLLEKHRWPVAGLMLGLPWAIWHGFADLDANAESMGVFWLASFTVFWLAPLPAYRILMTWCYARNRSALLGVLMHAGYTGWLFVLSPELPMTRSLIWQGAFAGGLWLLVLILVLRQATIRK